MLTTQDRFFGLELAALSRDLSTAWRNMLDWPVLAWLWPKLHVRLWLDDGTSVLSRGPATPSADDPKRALMARFQAIELPDRLLLRSSLQVPALPAHELLAALELQVSSLSPFSADELVWAYEAATAKPGATGMLTVHLVITSRKLIAQYMLQTHASVDPGQTEIWVPRAAGHGNLVLTGFGEAVRARQGATWRWVSIFLVVVSLLLATAIALTPSVQLYLRTLDAHAAMAVLQQKAAPTLKQRESFTHTSDQLSNLAELVGQPLPPLNVLKIVTDALPDDTSLLGLQVQGAKVTLSGQTANAAALMKQLGATAGLRDVIAPTPATKPLGATREQFTIEFTLDAVQVPTAK
jgi:general secretion pathway protein L